MNEAEVLEVVESIFVIVFQKSLLLNCEGIFRSSDVWLFINLATVLNKNLNCFGYYL